MEGHKGHGDAGLLETKRTDVVDQQIVSSQSASGHKVKDADVLPTSELETDAYGLTGLGLTMDCLYRGDAADSEQETSDVEDGPLQ